MTLIFGIDRYDEVMEAYISGLETMVAAGRGAELAKVASVASFFVSRVDTEVDRRLETLAGGESGDAAILALRGKAAVAQARVAYRHFRAAFPAHGGKHWRTTAPGCSARCGRRRRPRTRPTTICCTWTSLIGPATVNTMPDGTIAAFEDHGTVARTVDADPDDATGVLAQAGRGRHRHGPTWSRRWKTRACTPSPSRSTSCCSR